MSERVRGRLLAGWAAAVVGVLALNVLWPFPGHEQDWPWVAGLMAFPVAAALVLTHRPRNVIGRLLGVVGMAAGAIFLLSWYVLAFPSAPLSRQAEAVEMLPAVVQFGGMLGLLHLFPTGSPLNRLHGWVVTALWWYVALFALLGVLRPGPLVLTGRSNPFGLGPQWLGAVHETGYAGLVLFMGLGVWVVIARWRSAGQVERAQLKWFFAGAAWVLVIFLVNGLFPGDVANPVVNQLANIVVVVAFWGLPFAVVIAVTRYHLFDIDQIVSRTVGYTLVAGVLGVVYAASVVGLQAILPVGGSDVAVAGSTLAAAALFGPVHSRVQRVVDRQFNRARYEIASVTYDFASRIRREVDIDTVAHNLRLVVNETMQPASVDLWLRTPPAPSRGRRSVEQTAT